LGAPTTIASFCVVALFGFLSIITWAFYHASLLQSGVGDDASITYLLVLVKGLVLSQSV